jgi:AIR synthase-related protein
MNLADITSMLQNAKGVAHKHDIAPILAQLNLGDKNAIAVGDDCAAIPDGDSHLLLAIEGFMPEFVAADPEFAGYCGIMVNLSDIAAMGGRPIAVVDAIWTQNAAAASPILSGLKTAAARYGIPIVGGHTNTRADNNLLSVAILGRAQKLLTSFDAKPDQNIIAAIDLRGQMRENTLYWDASTQADPVTLRAGLNILPAIAEQNLSAAAKDISMAGIIGTTLMLLESSRLGALIDLTKIPRPPEISLENWLLSFPSYGFLLAAAPENTASIIEKFAAQNIAAATIATTNASRIVELTDGVSKTTFWNLRSKNLIGCAA